MNELRGLWHGKRLGNGEWIEGWLWRQPDSRAFVSNIEVDPATLGECTVYRNKNDTPIFEGDILKVK